MLKTRIKKKKKLIANSLHLFSPQFISLVSEPETLLDILADHHGYGAFE